jgi:ribosomal protein S18 acetylase RimI-like enzyme
MQLEYRPPTVSEYHNLRKSVGWWRTEEACTEAALNNSLFSVVAVKDGDMIGLGRIIGDGGLYFYIQDLIVHPTHQRMGIGKKLMAELMTHLKANAKPGAFIGLMAAAGLTKYYELFGFKARPTGAPGMYQVVE